MDLLHNLALGFSVLADPMTIVYSLIGVVCGVIIGALPGLGPSVGIAVLLPMCYGLDPACALCMLCGIYYGAMYGGSITSILINTPGDSAAIMTTLDGYPMARQGKAGKALGMSCLASVIGGTISVVLFMSLAPVVSNFATKFGPSEYFALMVLGLTSIAGMTGKSPAKGFLAAFIGLFVAGIGIDLIFGTTKFVFGNVNLYSGIDFVPVAMGLFGIAEIVCNYSDNNLKVDKGSLKVKNLLPSRHEWKLSLPHIGRGTILGFIVGMLPGAGATIASFLSYDMAKRTSKRGEEFGTGVIEGVKVLLVKPQTFMNLSGESIREVVDFYKVDPETEFLVIYDDISLAPGHLRIRKKGSAGGHNGIKNIILHLGTQVFPRVRVGVGEKPEGYDLADYVLGHFQGDEKKLMEEAYDRAAAAVAEILTDGPDKAMNDFN